VTVPPESIALRFLIDSTLLAHDGRCMDEQDDRDAVAKALVEVLIEYLGPAQQQTTQST
jgi:hypothetical protein